MLQDYPETTFGGDFPTNTVYTDPEVQKLIEEKGWILWPPIPYSYDTVLKGEGRDDPAAAVVAALAGHRRPGAAT